MIDGLAFVTLLVLWMLGGILLGGSNIAVIILGIGMILSWVLYLKIRYKIKFKELK